MHITVQLYMMICPDGNNDDDDDDDDNNNNNNNNNRNITRNTESTAVRNLKHERWGSPLVQEGQVPGRKDMTQETTATNNNNNNNNNNTQDRKVVGNKPDIIIKNKKDMNADTCFNTRGQKCQSKGSRKEIEIE